MRNLSVQWVDGLRGSVTKRRDTAAKFLAQLKNQSGDYAKAHHAVIAECDKMLAASEMNRESFRKLIEENAELRKRCEAYEMLNLGLQEMLDAKACPDCHKQNS
jgi:hypothetical protein